MIDCKNCFHYDVCKEHESDTNVPWLMFTDVQNCKFFKDKSSIFELPVKINDEVYILWKDYTHGWQLFKDTICVIKILSLNNKEDIRLFSLFHRFSLGAENINNTIFFDKSKAEAKLEELQKG